MAIFQHETRVRVRYAETDRMGYVYYGNYASYFEVGRVEALRELGFPYKQLEDVGVLLPVRDMHVRYWLPAKYDDLLTVRTSIVEVPVASIKFTYEIMNEQGDLLTSGDTTLVFVDQNTGRPTRAPEAMAMELRELLG